MILVFLFSAGHSGIVSPYLYSRKEFLFMEVIYSKACGVDLHKRFIVVVICDASSANSKYIRKRFSIFNNQLIAFRNWLFENDCQNVCIESTGKYYIPVYNAWKTSFPMSSLPKLNRLKLSNVRRMTIRVINGLTIYLNLVSFDQVIFALRIFVFSEN